MGSRAQHLTTQRPENRGANTVGPSPSPKAPEPSMSVSKGSHTRMSRPGGEQIGPPSAFLSGSGPQRMMPTALFNLIQVLISPSNTDTPRNNILPAIWASLSPAELTHEINHHHRPKTICNTTPKTWNIGNKINSYESIQENTDNPIKTDKRY